jgi:hypothetical protein
VITVVIDQIHIHISLPEPDMGNKLDAITAAIADVKNTVSAEFDNLATAVNGEVERITQKLLDAIAAGGDPAALQVEVNGAVDSLTDLKTTIADKVGSLKTALDGIDGVVGNIDDASAADSAAASSAAASTADSSAAASTAASSAAV